ncbi:ethionine resistance protein [Elasticomyces elasticus]|nr:ethionine resistance protein [Elasticomyces elasticus]
MSSSTAGLFLVDRSHVLEQIFFKASISIILAYILQNSLQTVSILIVGRSSFEALSVAAFSYMSAMATAWLIGMGGTTGIDTLASPSFTGSNDKHDLGIILQRAPSISTLFYLPIIILWIFAEPVLRGLKFLTVLIPGGFGYIFFKCMKNYLQAQGTLRPGTYVLLITSPINACLNFLFSYTFKIGLLGTPITTGISYWLSFLRTVDGWLVRNAGVVSTVVTSRILASSLESQIWLWYMPGLSVVAVVAGQPGAVPLVGQSIIMTADQVMDTIPFGVSATTSARVDNLLGARDGKGAAGAANTAA